MRDTANNLLPSRFNKNSLIQGSSNLRMDERDN